MLADDTTNNSNESFVRIPDLQLEAACTVYASRESSRMFLVDNLIERSSKAKDIVRRPVVDELVWGARYFQARFYLSSFRQKHPYHLDVGLLPQDVKGRKRPLRLTEVELGLCVIYVVVWAIEILAYRRAFVVDKRTQSAFGLKAAFVLIHLVTYRLPARPMMYSSRAAALVSLHGLASCCLLYRSGYRGKAGACVR